LDEVWKDGVYSYGGIGLPDFPNMFMLYGPFSPINNVPVPLGLDQEINYIMRLIALAREKNVAIAPTRNATENFLERLKRALPDTVWVGCRNWYSDQTGVPILWPLPQNEHAAFFESVDVRDLEFTPKH
jgi:hypothetical protein